VGVATTGGETIEDGLDGCVGRASRLAERHGDVEPVDHDVTERSLVPSVG
jgi:hypothetical protein